jgi:hypothetical protein
MKSGPDSPIGHLCPGQSVKMEPSAAKYPPSNFGGRVVQLFEGHLKRRPFVPFP